MKIINNLADTKPTRTIVTCANGEAFRLGADWYTKIEISDFGIRSSKDEWEDGFVELHTLLGHENASYLTLVPCLHISSSAFVYIDGNRTADEWATLSATLTTP